MYVWITTDTQLCNETVIQESLLCPWEYAIIMKPPRSGPLGNETPRVRYEDGMERSIPFVSASSAGRARTDASFLEIVPARTSYARPAWLRGNFAPRTPASAGSWVPLMA